MTTGQRIKAAREKAGMTQADLAKKLGIPYQSIGQWERDIRNPKKETLQRIAAALGVSILELRDPTLKEAINMSIETALKPSEMPSHLETVIAEYIQESIADESNGRGENKQRIYKALKMLNDEGVQKASERIEELTEIPRYQRKSTSVSDSDTEPADDDESK